MGVWPQIYQRVEPITQANGISQSRESVLGNESLPKAVNMQMVQKKADRTDVAASDEG